MVDGVSILTVSGQVLDEETRVPLAGVRISHRKAWSNDLYDATISSSTGFFALKIEQGFWGEMISTTENLFNIINYGSIRMELEKDCYEPEQYEYETEELHNTSVPVSPFFLGEIGLRWLDQNESY